MKALACAIIVHAFLMTPKAEFEAMSDGGRNLAALIFAMFFLATIFLLIVEGNNKNA